MANDDHIAQLNLQQLLKGDWNTWRRENPDIRPDLSGADLMNFCNGNFPSVNFREANLTEADLRGADLRGADLLNAWLVGAKLRGADLSGVQHLGVILSSRSTEGVDLRDTVLRETDLKEANLEGKNLSGADLSGADLSEANLCRANLLQAKLSGANLRRAILHGANLGGANLSGANLGGAHLEAATLLETDFTAADLTGCHIYGASAWGLKLDRAKQQSLVITPYGQPEITVDNIEVAQFVYLLLHNEKIRDVIDTVTSKAVLILGRFTDERKAVLDALRDELRKRDYLPILFDFEVPARRNITETVTLLARMTRFVIADLTDPSSIPQELQAIIPSVRVPVQPVLLEGSSLYSMFKDFRDYPWVLPVYQYKKPEQLLATLAEEVIAPAERKAQALAERRRMIEAE